MATAKSEYPPFVLGKPRFNQETYYGRLRHFLEVVDPTTLLTSEKELQEAIKLLDDFKNGTLPAGVTDEQLWKAQKTKQAIIHPDTQEKIFPPFRMAGYVPFGSISVIGLLLPNQTIKQIIFWQWLNQSHNAAVNYSNRNATKPTPTSRFVAGYLGAVSSAVSIAVGLSLALRSKRFSRMGPLMERFVPYPAVACANLLNVTLMRNNELKEGIEVFDNEGQVIGTSKIAAKRAVKDTILTRLFLPAPILLFPPIIMARLERTHFLKARPRLLMPIQAAVATLCFAVSLPLAISLFPQTSKISKSDLEPEVAVKTTASELYYNKGL